MRPIPDIDSSAVRVGYHVPLNVPLWDVALFAVDDLLNGAIESRLSCCDEITVNVGEIALSNYVTSFGYAPRRGFVSDLPEAGQATMMDAFSIAVPSHRHRTCRPCP